MQTMTSAKIPLYEEAEIFLNGSMGNPSYYSESFKGRALAMVLI